MARYASNPAEIWARSLQRALRGLFDDRPVTAIELGNRLNLKGSHETVRRRIRRIVKDAREKLGLRICANDGHNAECGYWFARNDDEWQSFLEARKTRAKFTFVSLRRQREAAVDRGNEQGRLFGPVTAWDDRG